MEFNPRVLATENFAVEKHIFTLNLTCNKMLLVEEALSTHCKRWKTTKVGQNAQRNFFVNRKRKSFVEIV